MPHRFLGYKPDKHDPRDKIAVRRRAGIQQLPAESRLWMQIPRSRDQGATSSCTGHGGVGGLELHRVLTGKPDIALSPAHLYANARLSDMLGGEALTDDGAYVRSTMRVAKNLGVARESAWPLSVATINDRPSELADESGLVTADADYQRVEGTDQILLENLLDALVDGPVVTGMQVTQRFMDHIGDGVLEAPGPTEQYVGGHCTYFAGYRNNGLELFLANSWADWGFDFVNTAGHTVHSGAWVSCRWVTSPGFGDAWIYRGAA